MGILRAILSFLKAFFTSRAAPAAENVMLRQQLIVTHRSVPRPELCRMDRIVAGCPCRRFDEQDRQSNVRATRPALMRRGRLGGNATLARHAGQHFPQTACSGLALPARTFFAQTPMSFPFSRIAPTGSARRMTGIWCSNRKCPRTPA